MRMSERFAKTADFLAKTGLVEYTRFYNGRYCALGALGKVVRNDHMEDSIEETDLLVKYLGLQYRLNTAYSVADWSNELVVDGKPHEVIAGLRRAAEMAAADGL